MVFSNEKLLILDQDNQDDALPDQEGFYGSKNSHSQLKDHTSPTLDSNTQQKQECASTQCNNISTKFYCEKITTL
ncbi:hypothetical protein PtB15_1B583 [Puccinia triticina]|nr:hypothetical protein PtB15_1B583 [Puccinia triticina]